MHRLHFGRNFAIFVLFFGLSMFEALRTHSWPMAAVWAGFALFFLVADRREQHAHARR